ncbi:cell division cycle-associated protein 7 isoform X2 [Esox lucius]|uniref:cell division cycle-associated protein 7 isoform X2 n=1 Tax=Esox lucius TaxID=8010 RepID=UPI001476ED93|nr:cell division cycle-associated protein 7 isoform X2 [Esox lucius]
MDDSSSVLGMSSFASKLADIFAEESGDEKTFYGFSDTETDLCDNKRSDSDSPKETTGSSPKQHAPCCFTFRVALRPRKLAPPTPDTSEEEEAQKTVEKKPNMKVEHVKAEDEDKPVTKPDSDLEADYPPQSFLSKRDQNIKANKAMLAQLMADLDKMPGGALLKGHGGSNLKKEKSNRAPRSKDRMSRGNPDRSSRVQTRSMGGVQEGAGAPAMRELQLSLEEELLEVRGQPKRRGAPRPLQTKPHVIRPVDEITADDLQLVADNTTEKVYSSATGSTCHQCRQKTIDTKTCCRNEDCHGIVGQFCGPCLRNRYGEDVRKALLDPDWRCPPCRGICNCSFCRARDGRCPTGILLPLAQYHGFSDVHSYLSSLRSKLKSGED